MKFFRFIAILSISVIGFGHSATFNEENSFSVLNVIEDKVYVKKDNISITEIGFEIFETRGSGFISSELFVDEFGVYTKLSSISDEKVWNIVYCNHCNTWRSINPQGKCNICGKNPAG